MRLSLPGHGIAILVPEDWSVHGPSDAASIELHGVYLTHGRLTMHVRGMLATAGALDVQGLEDLLRQQNWASDPFDTTRWRRPPIVCVAGTFEMDTGQCVREWFLTDGRCLANCAAVGDAAEIRRRASACETVVRAIQFDD